MSGDRDGVAGFRLTGRTWTDELGVWSSAVAADGRSVGALRFDPRLVAAPSARERLIAAVIAHRRLGQSGVTGLVQVTDLVTAGDEVWLITSEPVSPTVSDLLSGLPGPARPDAGSATTVLLETAQTLLAVHASGLAHGELHPGTVVIAPDGSALLAERGLADALLGHPPAPERDVAAWASLARGLAATWASADRRAAELLERVAATASIQGLAHARDVLLAGSDVLPPGFTGHERLLETLHRWSASQTPGGGGYPQPTGLDEGEIVTLLHVPGTDERHSPDTRPVKDTGEVVLRFGPGVPSETTAAQIWRAGRDQQQTEPPSERLRAASATHARRRRGRTVLSTAILALMIVGALALWLSRGSSPPPAPLEVTGVAVSAPERTQGCDTTVRITGILSTNGAGGQVRYRWKRSDREEPIVQTDQIPSGTASHEVNLEWTVKGEGDFKGTATLALLSPVPEGKKLQDRATFTYRCS